MNKKPANKQTIIMYYIMVFICSICTYAIQATLYDVIVIGGGPTGIVAARAAAGYGKRVAVIDNGQSLKSKIASADIPLKALIKASQIVDSIHHSMQFGCDAAISLPAHNVFTYIKKVAKESRNLYKKTIERLTHIDIIQGHAYFIDPHTLLVDDRKYYARKFIIATGGDPYVPSIQGINHIPYYTKDTFFSLDRLPSSIIIVGQGPLGVEFATALHRLGVNVTFLVKHGVILPNYDFELVEEHYKLLKRSGVNVFCGVIIKEFTYNNDTQMVTAVYENQHKETESCQAEAVLFALDLIGNTSCM